MQAQPELLLCLLLWSPSWVTTGHSSLGKKNRSKEWSRQNPSVTASSWLESHHLLCQQSRILFWFLFFKENSLHFLFLWGKFLQSPIVGKAIAIGATWHWSWPWFNIRIHQPLLSPKGNCCPVIDRDGEITLMCLLHYFWLRHGLWKMLKDIFIALISFCFCPSYTETVYVLLLGRNVKNRICKSWRKY